jgi:hypothetical protein
MTHVRKLGAGCFGYADLYKDKKGNFYVLKHQKVLESELVLDGKKLQFKSDCRFQSELMFFAWVAKLTKNKKYFMQLLDTKIEKGANFDTSRLETDCGGAPIFARLKQSPYVYTMKLTYAGEQVQNYCERAYDEYYDTGSISAGYSEIFTRMAKDLCLITQLVNKAGFFLDDLHYGNVCWNGDNCVLIDYGEVKIIGPKTTVPHKRYYDVDWDTLSVLRIFLGYNYAHDKISQFMDYKHASLLITQAACKSEHWPQISQYTQQLFRNTDLAHNGTLARIFTDIANDTWVESDIRYIGEFIDYIWCALSPQELEAAWQSEQLYPVTRGASIHVPLLLPQAHLLAILTKLLH